MSHKNRSLRKKVVEQDDESDVVDELHRGKLEDVKISQKQRKRAGDALVVRSGETDLMETYVKAKPLEGIVAPDEDLNMRNYVEKELARRIGRRPADVQPGDEVEAKRQRQEDELYNVPDKYKNSLSHREVVIPGLITGITEVVLPTDVRLKNIEDTEAAKRRLLAASTSSVIEEDAGRHQLKGSMRRGLFPSSFGHAKKRQQQDDDDDGDESRNAQHRKYVKDPNVKQR